MSKILTIAILISLGSVWAAEREEYFVVVYAYQDARNHASSSHTFAEFIRVTHTESGRSITERETISWLPNHFARSLSLSGRSKGRNFTLHDTRSFAQRIGAKVFTIGAFPIDKRLYDKVKPWKNYLETRADYKMIEPDRGGRKGPAYNCIHAVSDMVGKLETGSLRGVDASRAVVQHFARRGYLSNQSQNWVIDLVAGHSNASPHRQSSPRLASPGTH